jgi:hypothetical protein
MRIGLLIVGCVDKEAHDMKIIRVGLHGLVLTIADLAGILIGGLAAFHILGQANQFWLQVPLAIVSSVIFFSVWVFLILRFRIRKLLCVSTEEIFVCLGVSFLWAPLVFVPVHFITQGYLTSVGNLVALAVYQIPVNGVALFGPWGLPLPESEANSE